MKRNKNPNISNRETTITSTKLNQLEKEMRMEDVF